MASFALQVANFEKYGTFNYKFDEAGNVILNPSSSVFQQFYIALPLTAVNYNNSKLTSFYDTVFTEFVSATPGSANSSLPNEVADQINDLQSQNVDLQNRLDSLVAQSELDSSAANAELVKDIIIALRIQIGQGATSSDFQNDFPYLPLTIEQQDNALL